MIQMPSNTIIPKIIDFMSLNSNFNQFIMHILIAGVGQLGSRYLEGIAKCNHSHKITLIDPPKPH